MKSEQLEKTLVVIRSLIALSLAMVVALLVLAGALWLQSEGVTPTDDPTSTIGFLLPILLGGLAAGVVTSFGGTRGAMGHGLGFAAIYLLMFYPGWLAADAIGAGLIAGLTAAGLVLGLLGARIGHRLRGLRRRPNE